MTSEQKLAAIMHLQNRQAAFLAEATAERERLERELAGYDYCFSRSIKGVPTDPNRVHRVTASTWDNDFYRDEQGHVKSAGQRRVRAISKVKSNMPKSSANVPTKQDRSRTLILSLPSTRADD